MTMPAEEAGTVVGRMQGRMVVMLQGSLEEQCCDQAEMRSWAWRATQ